MRRYWYSILLTGSMIVMASADLSQDMPKNNPLPREAAEPADNHMAGAKRAEIAESVTSAAEWMKKEESTAVIRGTKETAGMKETAGTKETAGMEETAGTEEEAGTGTMAGTEESAGTEKTVETGGEMNEDFSNVLFIGDSRTVGLSEYGDLGQADVFATSGMTVFELFRERVSVKGEEKKTLEELLSLKRYRTIYLMLGINELGYEEESIVGQYRSVVEKIRAEQPAAVLVLAANLHVTRKKAAKSRIYNNLRIDGLNQSIEKIAEDTGCRYIDVNSIFDDENGNLSAAYSTDGAHILGKYYSVWVEWIRNGG